MKLSLKFFCIAYVIVLLSLGTAGMFLINTASDALWDSKSERVDSAINYAVDSFLSFADISDVSEDNQRKNITEQIRNFSDSCVTDVKIISAESAPEDYLKLQDNTGFSKFTKENDLLIMENVCRVSAGTDTYFVCIYSDFTYEQNYSRNLRNGYFFVILLIASVSGLILYILANRITKPLNILADTASDIAAGNYGKTVNVKSNDFEIINLSDSFNSMSVTVKDNVEKIKQEAQKRDTFVADFTHEMKTPMTAIIGYSQMLNSYELDAEETKQAALAINNEAKRLEKLSLQLLNLYVLGNEKTEFDAVSLDSISNQLNSTLKFLSQKYRVLYSVNFDDSSVVANRELLLSLLYNLADNAFKASDENQTVKIYSKLNSGYVTIYVSDSGNGINKENIGLLTEPFFREDKARSRELGGAGLGLSICNKIAELHGTELYFVSEKGKGTTVSFNLKTGGEANE
ncbi:MAG: HAMP domain-containing histidine kinase [Clostridia bacterium]|nr:HAMP domain-containing histidine kinase [Clostridia bacterium]